MASGIFYPAASGDNGGWRTGYFNNDGEGVIFGSNAGAYHGFFKFTNITIPYNAVIQSAFVRLTSYWGGGSSTVVNVRISLNDIDDSVAPTNVTEADALSLTTAFSDWDNLSTWIQENTYDTPSIINVVQEVIDRGGWTSGNSIMVLIKDNGSTYNSNRQASAIDYSSGVQKAELHITWTPQAYDINVTNPSITAAGLTGISATTTSPMMQAEGYTGIDARNVINPLMTTEGFTGIYSAPSIPMIRANATLSDNMIHVESSLTIPSMTAEVTQADQIWGNVTIPAMTAEITERETVLGNVSIPMTTVELASGIHADLEVTIPIMTTEGTFSNQCEVTLPMMTVEVEGIVGKVINSDIRLPMMAVEMEGRTEHLINCDVSVPIMRAVVELITGKLIIGAATIPMMEAALTSYEDITGDIDAFVPMMEAYMVATAERAECAVLRYLEPAL